MGALNIVFIMKIKLYSSPIFILYKFHPDNNRSDFSNTGCRFWHRSKVGKQYFLIRPYESFVNFYINEIDLAMYYEG